jgi:hypothetical protein
VRLGAYGKFFCLNPSNKPATTTIDANLQGNLIETREISTGTCLHEPASSSFALAAPAAELHRPVLRAALSKYFHFVDRDFLAHCALEWHPA